MRGPSPSRNRRPLSWAAWIGVVVSVVALLAGEAGAAPLPGEDPPKAPAASQTAPPEAALKPPKPASPQEKGRHPADGQALQGGEGDWVQTSDDSVIDAATLAAQQANQTSALFAGNGFNGFGSRNYGDYSIVLVNGTEGNVEQLRGSLEATANGVNASVGVSLRVNQGTIPGPSDPVALTPQAGEIHVIVASSSGCGGSGWAGCGGPRGYRSFGGIGHYTGGVVWIHPSVLGYSAANRQHVVEHEVGHALGLDHFDGLYAGEYQVMHSSSYPASPGFHSGDINGFKWLVDTPPTNDNVSAATTVGPEPAVRSADTWFATKETNEPAHAARPSRRSVWFKYVPTAEQNGKTATIRTTADGTDDFDTTLGVYRGSMYAAPIEVASNDDYDGINSQVSFVVNSGQTYWIAIDGYGWGRGETDVEFLLPIVRPPNDNFANALAVAANESASGSNVNATTESGEPTDSGGNTSQSVWWRVTPNSGGFLTVDTLGSDFDTVISVLTGSSLSGLTEVAYNDDASNSGTTQSKVGLYVNASTTYYIRVDGWSSSTGSISLTTSLRENSEYTPVTPRRILDSRNGTGAQIGPWGPDESSFLQVAGGSTGVPSDATAVVLNLTATNTTSTGWVTVYPVFDEQPLASNLNWRAGQTIANQVVVRVPEDELASGHVVLYNKAGSVDFVADVVGYFSERAGDRFSAVSPARVLDSRYGNGTTKAPFQDGTSRVLQVAGRGGVPYGASAAVLNLTATGSTAGGWAVAYPNGTSRPLASSVNWKAGENAPNHAIVPLGPDGSIRLFTRTGGKVDLVADVVGWYGPAGTTSFQPLGPIRVLDSRYGTGTTRRAFGRQESRTIQAAQVGVPTQATGLIVNTTVVNGTSTGYLTAWGAGASRPLASNLNWRAGDIRANLVTTPVSGARYQLWNAAGSADFVGDVTGYYVP